MGTSTVLRPTLIVTYSHGLYPALVFLYFNVTVLCSTVQSKKKFKKKKKKPQTPDKHQLHSEQGLRSFYFQFKHFKSVLEVTKFSSSAMREEFKLKLKSRQPEVRCYQ